MPPDGRLLFFCHARQERASPFNRVPNSYFLKYMLPISDTASITIIAVRPISAISRRSPSRPDSIRMTSTSAMTEATPPIVWNIFTFSSFVNLPFGRLIKFIDITSHANPDDEAYHHESANCHIRKEKVAVHRI